MAPHFETKEGRRPGPFGDGFSHATNGVNAKIEHGNAVNWMDRTGITLTEVVDDDGEPCPGFHQV